MDDALLHKTVGDNSFSAIAVSDARELDTKLTKYGVQLKGSRSEADTTVARAFWTSRSHNPCAHGLQSNSSVEPEVADL